MTASFSEMGSSDDNSESEQRLSKLYMAKNKPMVLGEKVLEDQW